MAFFAPPATQNVGGYVHITKMTGPATNSLVSRGACSVLKRQIKNDQACETLCLAITKTWSIHSAQPLATGLIRIEWTRMTLCRPLRGAYLNKESLS